MIKFSEIELTGSKWANITGNWSIKGPSFIHSPENVQQASFNLFICDKIIRNGAVEGNIRVSRGGDNSGRLVFRYGPRGCYYAGVGGYGRHFAIVKQIRDNDGRILSVGIALTGSDSEIRFDEPYDIRVEFIEDNIILKNSGVIVLEAKDNWFEEGNIGFDTYGPTKVEFSNYKAFEIPPVGTLTKILESFPYTLKRDLAYHKRELNDEKDVQRVLWTILRSHYSDLVDEEILGKFGLKHYQNDFGIPSLRTIVEVKFVRDNTNLKDLQDELIVDSVGYLKSMTNYTYLVCFIYNKANRHIDSSFISALQSQDSVAAVIIVPSTKI